MFAMILVGGFVLSFDSSCLYSMKEIVIAQEILELSTGWGNARGRWMGGVYTYYESLTPHHGDITSRSVWGTWEEGC